MKEIAEEEAQKAYEVGSMLTAVMPKVLTLFA